MRSWLGPWSPGSIAMLATIIFLGAAAPAPAQIRGRLGGRLFHRNWTPAWEYDWRIDVQPALPAVTPDPAELFKIVPIFPEPKVAAPIPAASLDKLSPGARPIVILVSQAGKEVVARSAVTWGFKDAAGKLRTGGAQVFDHQGGVALGEIPKDILPDSVEIVANVDYVNPDVADLTYVLAPRVTDSGVQVRIETTSNIMKQHFLFKLVRQPDLRDFLVVEFRYRTNGSGGGRLLQKGAVVLSYAHLLRAKETVLAKSLEMPLPAGGSGALTWSVYGFLQGQRVEIDSTVSPDRGAVLLLQSPEGALQWFHDPQSKTP